MGWKPQIDVGHPCWTDFRDALARLPDSHFPSTEALNGLLDGRVRNARGRPIRFRASQDIPSADYEAHIFATGEVSTREDNWHDLCNALVWARWPAMKSAFNALHQRGMRHSVAGSRGPLRDALTLLDESGALIVSDHEPLLSALAARDWSSAFVRHADRWSTHARIFVCGHAVLEKFKAPYKSLTAHCLLLRVPRGWLDDERTALRQRIDLRMSDALLEGRILDCSAHLSPLPLMGIPGWWSNGPQDEDFYADSGVFRPAAPHHRPAPIFDA